MKVKLEIFEGPLDLLLYLIKRNDLNIYDIPITNITQQYLEYIELMKFLDLDIAGEFMVMAATLLEIKSKMLLPQPEIEEPEEEFDPREDLVKRLLEYKKFKEVAARLKDFEVKRQQVFSRPTVIEDDGESYFEASLFDLITCFTKALKDVPRDILYEVIKDEFTVEQKIHDILHLLAVKTKVSLSDLFGEAKNKLEIVATFLAILELIRLKEINIRQKKVFGAIVIIRNKVNIKAQQAVVEETKN